MLLRDAITRMPTWILSGSEESQSPQDGGSCPGRKGVEHISYFQYSAEGGIQPVKQQLKLSTLSCPPGFWLTNLPNPPDQVF